MIGANHLFGMDTELPYTATAIGDTSILCISKDNFVNLLGMDHIYLLNYLNYLSLHVQRAEFCQRISSKGTVTEFIARCLLIFTEKTSYNIEIECTLRNISALINSTISETQLALKSLQRKELIEIDGKTIKVPSRLSLIDYVTPEQL
jgi:CRP-like cAMP-binding protein